MATTHENLRDLFSDIADAIRSKTGENRVLVADEFPDEIEAIQTGGGGGGSDDYFYVEGVQAGSIKFSYYGTVDVALQYSTDKTNWTDYTLDTSVNIAVGQKIYWKNNKDYLSTSDTNRVYLTSDMSNKYNVGGRINSLINDIDSIGCYAYAFCGIFTYSKVVDASNLILPTRMSDSCFSKMFIGCSSLTAAPELPATILKSKCYESMFENCTSLTQAPELPATTIASSCYKNMFRYCTSLTEAPELPATTLYTYCYQSMFENCSSLTKVPELPATTLLTSCYASMFNGCTALKVYSVSGEGHDKAWSIPTEGVISGTERTQSGMFNGVQTDSVDPTFTGTVGQQFTYYTQNTPV